MHSRYPWLFLVPWLGACGGAHPSTTDVSSGTCPVNLDCLDVSPMFKRAFKTGTLVFLSQAELDSAWAQAPYAPSPFDPRESPQEPVYDFSKNMVVGCSFGLGEICPYPYLTHVERTGSDTVVHWTVPTWSTSECTTAFIGRVVFVLVSRADGDVSCVQDPFDPQLPWAG